MNERRARERKRDLEFTVTVTIAVGLFHNIDRAKFRVSRESWVRLPAGRPKVAFFATGPGRVLKMCPDT